MEKRKTKVVTGRVRFSYANVWEPKSVNGGEERYNVCLIIPKSDKKTIADINAAIDAAALEGKARFGGIIPADLKLPLRDGDAERQDDEAYKGSWFVNATSKDKPHIVDRDVKPIEDRAEFYSGCYGRASLYFYAFNVAESRGVSCRLCNLQKISDGEMLTGRSSPEEDFSAEEGLDFLG